MSAHVYPRGTVLKWTRKAMADSHQRMPQDRMIVLDEKTVIWYVEDEVRQTDMLKTQDSLVVPSGKPAPRGLRIDVREMSDDPGIPALIREFGMVED